jgi:hypothetical protein
VEAKRLKAHFLKKKNQNPILLDAIYIAVLGILLMWAVRRWPKEAFQAAQTGARAHQPLGL